MWAALSTLLLTTGAVLDAYAPDPVSLLLVTPTGESGRVSRSEAIRAVSASLAAHSRLSPVLSDPIVNEDCRGRLACIVRVLRSSRSEVEAQWLLVVTQITLEGEPDRVSLTLVNISRATPLIEGLDEAEAEVRIDEASLRKPPSAVTDIGSFRELLDRAFRVDFRGAWLRSGHGPPRGSILLVGTPSGALVHVDERLVGTTSSDPSTRLERVARGVHRIRVSAYGTTTFETEVSVPERGSAEVQMPPQGSRGLRSGWIVGGGLLAAAGAGFLIGAAATDAQIRTACFSESPGCVGGASFVGFDYAPGASRPSDVDGGEVGMAPIGLGLGLAGMGIVLGALLEDGRDPPWWSAIAATAAGVAVFGAAVALDQGRVR